MTGTYDDLLTPPYKFRTGDLWVDAQTGAILSVFVSLNDPHLKVEAARPLRDCAGRHVWVPAGSCGRTEGEVWRWHDWRPEGAWAESQRDVWTTPRGSWISKSGGSNADQRVHPIVVPTVAEEPAPDDELERLRAFRDEGLKSLEGRANGTWLLEVARKHGVLPEPPVPNDRVEVEVTLRASFHRAECPGNNRVGWWVDDALERVWAETPPCGLAADKPDLTIESIAATVTGGLPRRTES